MSAVNAQHEINLGHGIQSGRVNACRKCVRGREGVPLSAPAKEAILSDQRTISSGASSKAPSFDVDSPVSPGDKALSKSASEAISPSIPASAGNSTPVLNYALVDPGRSLLSVGTLTYTSAALGVLFFWLLLGDFALAVRERSVGNIVQLMLRKYGAPDTLISILMTALPAAISLLINPLVSMRSDRHRSSWGRRIPFLLITTPFTAMSMVGLAYCPTFGAWLTNVTSIPLNTAVLSFFTLFWTIFEVGALASVLLVGALINDVVPRAVLGRFHGLFRLVSLAAGSIFNFWFLKWAETHFFEIFLGVAVIFGVGFTLMCLRVSEGQYPTPTDNPDDLRARGFVHSMKVYLRECFTSAHYITIFITLLVASLTFMPFNTFTIFYAKSLGVSADTVGKMIAISYWCSMALAFPLGWLVDKFHPIRVSLVAMSLYVVCSVYGAVFATEGTAFCAALLAHTVLSGTYFTASAALGQMLFPRERFGQFAAAGGQVVSLGTLIFGTALGPILDISGHNYRLTFVFGSIMALASVFALMAVYRNFLRHGGPSGYVAP